MLPYPPGAGILPRARKSSNPFILPFTLELVVAQTVELAGVD